MAARPVQVPMNFGRQHIGDKIHSLTVNMRDGSEMTVNSLILSYNSPVIKHMITELEMTSLDVQDFEKDAVTCFIDCIYSGGIEMLNLKVFRDLHKMAHVFEVDWLLEICQIFFAENLTHYELGMQSLDDDLRRCVEDAWYAFTKLKYYALWNVLIEAVNYLGLRDLILSRYYLTVESDFERLSTTHIDMLMALAPKRNNKLINSMMDCVQKSQTLSENAIHLLKNLKVTEMMPNHKNVLCDLFTIINDTESLSKDDIQLVSRLQLDALKAPDLHPAEMQAGHIGYLFRSLDPIETDNFFDFHTQVANKTTVKNLYSYIDYLFSWIEDYPESARKWTEEWTKAIFELKSNRSWRPIEKEYALSWGLSTEVLQMLEHKSLFPMFDKNNQQFFRVNDERWGGIFSDNRTRLSVFDLEDRDRFRHHDFIKSRASGKRPYPSNSNFSPELQEVTIETELVRIDHSVQIRYNLHVRDSMESNVRDCWDDFHLAVSAVCCAENPDDVKSFDYSERDLDKKTKMPIKIGLGTFVKRPDMFGDENYWKIIFPDGPDNFHILHPAEYMILSLYN